MLICCWLTVVYLVSNADDDAECLTALRIKFNNKVLKINDDEITLEQRLK